MFMESEYVTKGGAGCGRKMGLVYEEAMGSSGIYEAG